MNFAKIDAQDVRLASALGGLTNGVSPLEMAKAYATLENDGNYRNPSCIVKITDAEGNIIYQADQTELEVYKTNAARAMTDILESVMIDGTAKGLQLSNMACAGKTGTTNDNKDGWFVGYTPYYTTSVWVGYDTPQELSGLTGASYPGNIWKVFMTKIHQGLEYKDFLDVAAIDTENIGEDTLAEQAQIVEEKKQEEQGQESEELVDEAEEIQ
ncbi:MAG: glycosyl transferase, partial [Lachnospiraceae bacterium]|nr:glycosyl transferase [Lachnospiraceae bacterium]